MGRWMGWVLVLMMWGVTLADAAAPPAASSAAPGRPRTAPAAKATPLKMQAVTLHVFHRVFPNFKDKVDARLRQEFRIGDSEYTASVLEFVPDFNMDMKSHRVTTRSQEPRNPAFRIVVRQNGVPQDTTWAFLNMPPHFARMSLVAFIATRVTFENHAPVTSTDSLAIRLMKTEKP